MAPRGGKPVSCLRPEGAVKLGFHAGPVLFSPDSRRVLFWDAHAGAHVWDIPASKELAVLKDAIAPTGRALDLAASAAFSGDGEWIVTCCQDRTVRIWETATGKNLFVLKGHEDRLATAAFSANKSRIVSASADKTVRLWDAHTGDPLAVYRGHADAMTSAQFLAGDLVLSVDKNDVARVWPVDPLPVARSRAPRMLTAEEVKQYEVPAATTP